MPCSRFSPSSWNGLYEDTEESLYSMGEGFFVWEGSVQRMLCLLTKEKSKLITIALLSLAWTFLLSWAEKIYSPSCHCLPTSPISKVVVKQHFQWAVKSVSNRNPPTEQAIKWRQSWSCGKFNCLLRLNGTVPNCHSHFFNFSYWSV